MITNTEAYAGIETVNPPLWIKWLAQATATNINLQRTLAFCW